MGRITRKELKRDSFALEVENIFDYISEHRKPALWIGVCVVALAVIASGSYFYGKRQHAVRQSEMHAAVRIQQADTNLSDNPLVLSYASQGEKDAAAIKAFTDLASRYPGKDEGIIANYYLGTIASDQGRFDDAEKFFREVADSGNDDYASLAKLALAQIYESEGKSDEGAELLRSLIEKPTLLVTKEQSTIFLARLLAPTKPDEARKLLEPLRAERGAVSRQALMILGQLLQQ